MTHDAAPDRPAGAEMTAELDLTALTTVPSRQDWEQAALKALKGQGLDTLERTLPGGLRTQPIYARDHPGAGATQPADTWPASGLLTRGHLSPLRGEDMGPGSDPAEAIASARWDIRQRHAHADPQAANAAILDDLRGGVTSIVLQMEAPGQAGLTPRMEAISAALADVHLEMVGIDLDAGEDFLGAAQSLMEIWRQNGLEAGQANGGFGADPFAVVLRTGSIENGLRGALQVLAQFTALNAARYPGVTFLHCDALAAHNAGATPTLELATMAASLVELLRACEGESMAPHKVLATTKVTLGADTDLFLTIAKIRAARRIIARIAQACGAAMAGGHVQIGAETSATNMSAGDPYTNLLRTTVACAGAALADAAFITVLPFTHARGVPDAFAARMARNTHVILQEEAFLGDVIDPAGGSWYVEALTTQLAESAWTRFQAIEAAGGMADFVTSGQCAAAVSADASERAKAFTDGREKLIGVTDYAPAEPEKLAIADHPAPGALRREADAKARVSPVRWASAHETGSV